MMGHYFQNKVVKKTLRFSSWALSFFCLLALREARCYASAAYGVAPCQGMNVSVQQPVNELGSGSSPCRVLMQQPWPTAELQSHESL